MNRSLDRNNILLLNHRSSVEQDNEPYRTMRTNSSKIPVPFQSSSEETKKLIQKLQMVAKEQREKKEEAEIKYEQFKKRVVDRERQFHRILSKFDTHLPGDSKEQEYENYVNEIYKKILCTFQAFNEKARSLLDDRYSELYRLMERRIDILMQKMDKELAKYRKVSLTERKEIQQAIKEIGAIAAETQNQNVQFRKKNESMDLKLRMLNDEKRLLLEEITRLKAYIKEGMGKGIKKQKIKDSTVKDNFWKNIQSFQMQKSVNTKSNHRRTLTSRQQKLDSKSYKNPESKKNQNPNNTIDVFKLERQSVSHQNIISHLKQQLSRQKNKNLQLIKFSLQLEAKQEKIRELIGTEIKSIITRASQNSQPGSMVWSQQNLSSFNLHANQQKINSGKKDAQLNRNSETNPINMTLEQATIQLFAEQKRFSNLVSEINKILQLPQNSQFQGKFNFDTIEKKIQNKINAQNIDRNNKQLNKQENQKMKNPIINLNLVSSIGLRQNNRSVTKRYGSQKRYDQSNLLFANYSPLDIMDITKSIEIN